VRRKLKRIIFFLSSLALIIGLIPISVVGADDTTVSVEDAAAAARYYTYAYPSLPDAENTIIGETPITYYSVDHRPIAYEFTILDQGSSKPAGFIVIAATREWMPLLERGNGKAPSGYIPDINSTNRVSQTIDNPTIYYFGGMAYYVQLPSEDDKLMHLLSGNIISLPEKQPKLSMDAEQARDAWANIGQEPTREPFTEISGVPSWYQSSIWSPISDEGGGEDDWPDCRGNANDPWNNWDGCAPIAGAMVLGYWDANGYSAVPNDDETVIDDCHHFMDTDNSGATNIADIAPGIDDTSQYYGYDFICWLDTNETWSDVTGEINASRPFVLALEWDGGGHAITVRGYRTSTNEIRFHNTYDDWSWEMTFGDWEWADIIKVVAD